MGIVPQFNTVYPDLTVQEHLLFYARLKGTAVSEEKSVAQRMAAAIGLEDAVHKRASELSGGMCRRLSLGIALVGSPRILFCDEVRGETLQHQLRLPLPLPPPVLLRLVVSVVLALAKREKILAMCCSHTH